MISALYRNGYEGAPVPVTLTRAAVLYVRRLVAFLSLISHGSGSETMLS
jgi:hypothetical protein